MAATKYGYSISGDFPNHKVGPTRLKEEIQASGITSATVDHINTNDDECDVWFTGPLDSGDEATLDGLVAAHSGKPWRSYVPLLVNMFLEAVEAGVSRVVANGRPAIEIQDGITGFGSVYLRWPLEQDVDCVFRVIAQFVLKSSDTGTKVRIGVKVKAQATGEDSSIAFAPEGFTVATVNYTTIGEVFEAVVDLDGSGMRLGDAIALEVGRDGNNEMGAGDNDDVAVPIQIIAVEVGVA
jgi:hypothetical protein